MHFASDRWLQKYRYFTLGIQIILCLLFIVYAVMPTDFILYSRIEFLRVLTPLHAIIALVHIVLALFAYKPLVLKNQIMPAALLGAFVSLNVISIMHASGGLFSGWALIWLAICFASGVLGVFALYALSFLVTFYYVLLQVSVVNGMPEANTLIDMSGLAVIAATYLTSFGGWLFWKNHYISTENVELKKLSGQLKSRKQISDVLVQSIADGVIVTDTTGKITMSNPAASEITEWSTEESVGIDVREVVKLYTEEGKDIPAEENVFSVVLSGHKSVEQVLQLVGRNNKKQIVSLTVSPIIPPDSGEFAGTVAVIRDISEARAEEQRRADFISTASHEMRTPVAAIEGYLALALNEKVSKLDSNAKNYITKAHASTQHLGKLFQDLLTSAKAEDGRLVSHPTVVELSEFTEQLAEDLRFTAEKKGLMVDHQIGNSSSESEISGGKTVKPLYYVNVDPDRLREVVTNLFDNAVKYTEKGKITVGITGNNEVVQVFIKDTGPGIPAEDVSHLFQKFYRVDNSATRTIGGTGLGLFICRKIVELYNGRIWVESEVGKGSTFYINLPRLSTQEATQAQKQQQTSSQ